MAKKSIGFIVAGAIAGTITGLFGGGGGMLLIPLLSIFTNLDDSAIFPSSVTTILPICITSLLLQFGQGPVPIKEILMYLPGSAVGGILAGIWGKKIPMRWLHRLLGLLILWGGFQYLW